MSDGARDHKSLFDENWAAFQKRMGHIKWNDDGYQNSRFSNKPRIYSVIKPICDEFGWTIWQGRINDPYDYYIKGERYTAIDIACKIQDAYNNERMASLPVLLYGGGKNMSAMLIKANMTFLYRTLMEMLCNFCTSDNEDALDPDIDTETPKEKEPEPIPEVEFRIIEINERQKEYFGEQVILLKQWEDILLTKYPKMSAEDIMKNVRIAISKSAGKDKVEKINNLTPSLILKFAAENMDKNKDVGDSI